MFSWLKRRQKSVDVPAQNSPGPDVFPHVGDLGTKRVFANRKVDPARTTATVITFVNGDTVTADGKITLRDTSVVIIDQRNNSRISVGSDKGVIDLTGAKLTDSTFTIR